MNFWLFTDSKKNRLFVDVADWAASTWALCPKSFDSVSKCLRFFNPGFFEIYLLVKSKGENSRTALEILCLFKIFSCNIYMFIIYFTVIAHRYFLDFLVNFRLMQNKLWSLWGQIFLIKNSWISNFKNCLFPNFITVWEISTLDMKNCHIISNNY